MSWPAPAGPASRPWTPTPGEVALGTVFGPYPQAPPLPDPQGASPREALETVILGGLANPPCGVSFSGGRDSSLVLAVAAHVARREGLPAPIPLTHRFPGVPESREDDWQELVVSALGLPDWRRMSWQHEMDVLGPPARAVLRRVGVLDPFNAFFHEPFCAELAGGSLLTGVGGDELLAGVLEGPAFRIRYRGRRPRLAHLRPLLASYAPAPVRARRIVAADPFGSQRWLRPAARTDLTRVYAAWRGSDALAWDASVRHFWGSRECHLGLDSLAALATAHGVRMIHPLSSAPFVAAMVATHGKSGPGGRTRATTELAGDVLPPQLPGRSGKAAFGGAFWTGDHVGFADSWSGGGIDPGLVDADALRAEWRRPEGPDVASLLLLHQAWLHDDALG